MASQLLMTVPVDRDTADQLARVLLGSGHLTANDAIRQALGIGLRSMLSTDSHPTKWGTFVAELWEALAQRHGVRSNATTPSLGPFESGRFRSGDVAEMIRRGEVTSPFEVGVLNLAKSLGETFRAHENTPYGRHAIRVVRSGSHRSHVTVWRLIATTEPARP